MSARRGCLADMARRRRRKKGSLKGALTLLLIFAVLGAVIEGFRLARENPEVIVLGVLAGGGAIFGWRRWKTATAAQAQATAVEAERDALLGYDLSDLDILTGPAFEAWIAAVLQDAGFTTEDIQTSGDFGVDVIVDRHDWCQAARSQASCAFEREHVVGTGFAEGYAEFVL